MGDQPFGLLVRAGGGVGLPRLLAFCAEEGLGGLEGLSGIPGSAGGAVATNAGSFGVSIADRLKGVRVSRPGGSSSFVPRDQLDMGYFWGGDYYKMGVSTNDVGNAYCIKNTLTISF